MKPKLYIESTIPSYLTARPSRDLIVVAHQQITREWWETRKDHFAIYISQFVLDEIGAGDFEASKKRLDAIEKFEQLDITDDVTNLASEIIASGVIPKDSPTDAAHIAIAAVHDMQFLMTWNCAHIANAEISSVPLGIIFRSRVWCVFCPMGTLQGMIGRNKYLLHISKDCAECKICEKICPIGTSPSSFKTIGKVKSVDCLRCPDCMTNCSKKALRFGE